LRSSPVTDTSRSYGGVSAITADRGTDGHQSVSVADHQPIQHGEFQDGHDRQHERDSPSHTGSGTGEHKKLSAQSTDSTGATHTAGDRGHPGAPGTGIDRESTAD